jgi:serine/threonine-protein kinase
MKNPLPTELQATLEAPIESLDTLLAGAIGAPLPGRADALGLLRDTIAKAQRETIEPPHAGGASSAGEASVAISARDALAVLEALRGDPARRRRSLEIEGTLGEGGMGIVQLATQVSMGRKVAVKTLREEHRSEAATLRLLREAWVTGVLEHPNVVPVYDVGLDEHGAPVIVLKRIEGVHWGELIGDGERVRDRFGARDLLEWNLEILRQVCNAVHFAHARGIVHRDLKPENVMIGEFGEVYLLDWGIAVSLFDDGSGRLPLARDARHAAGTPCYMSPESLALDATPITARTDVYLLGAILFEILTGDPPHAAGSALETIASIVAKDPVLPEATPAELARICRRAMERAPAARFATAEELRRAIGDHLEHRESGTLAAEADASLAILRAELGAEGPATTGRRQRIYDAFGACRFGYREALRIWPENADARAGLREAVLAMIELELGARDARSARVLLGELGALGQSGELEATPLSLVERIDVLEREIGEDARRVLELERLGRDLDSGVGQRTRAFLGALAGLCWTSLPAALAHFETEQTAYRNAIFGPLVLLVGFSAVAWWARDSMSKTRINRSFLAAAFLALVADVLFCVGAWLLAVPASIGAVLSMSLWAVLAGAMALTIEPRLAIAAVGFFVTFLIACARPGWRVALMAAGNLLLTLVMAWSWGVGLKPSPTPSRR